MDTTRNQAHHLSPAELRAVQLTELELLCEVDRICRKCGISYQIIAGTLLGAVRHGGFIPWDDDADVAFLRGAYEKFLKACETELDSSKFYIQDYKDTPGYRWGYGKLRRRGTEFIRLNQEHMPYDQGVFIDLFPVDNVPDNSVLRSVHCFRCFLYRKAFWSEVGWKTAKGLERMWYLVMRRIPASRLYRSFDRFIEKSNNQDSGWARIFAYPTPTRDHGYYRKWAYSSAEYDFEGVKLYGIAEYDEYLAFKYGDYMALPPDSDRKTHPVSSLKLLDGDAAIPHSVPCRL